MLDVIRQRALRLASKVISHTISESAISRHISDFISLSPKFSRPPYRPGISFVAFVVSSSTSSSPPILMLAVRFVIHELSPLLYCVIRFIDFCIPTAHNRCRYILIAFGHFRFPRMFTALYPACFFGEPYLQLLVLSK